MCRRRRRRARPDLQRRLDQYAGQADLAVSILTASDMQPIAMAGRENATASTARAYWSPTRGLLIVADKLPMPPPGRIYQVWVIGGGTPVSAGLLGEQGSGRGMLIAPPPTGVAAGTVTVAVTDEPPGGLAAPLDRSDWQGRCSNSTLSRTRAALASRSRRGKTVAVSTASVPSPVASDVAVSQRLPPAQLSAWARYAYSINQNAMTEVDAMNRSGRVPASHCRRPGTGGQVDTSELRVNQRSQHARLY